MVELENLSLTEKEVADLINQYKSEIRKLEYQLERARGAIQELSGQSSVAVSKATVSAPKKAGAKRRGRPPKSAGAPEQQETVQKEDKTASNGTHVSEAPAQKRRGRPPKNTPKAVEPKKSRSEGYRLSEWDEFILGELKKAKHVMVNGDFLKKAMSKSKKEKLGLSEMDLRGKLNRSIHKLSNKRGELVKADFPGKGFAYGLKSWRDESGEIDPKYLIEFN